MDTITSLAVVRYNSSDSRSGLVHEAHGAASSEAERKTRQTRLIPRHWHTRHATLLCSNSLLRQLL